MNLADRDVEQAYKAHSEKNARRDDSFGLLYLSDRFNIDPLKAERQIAFSGNDFGIDGFHFDEEKRNFYIYQFKWSSDPVCFKDSMRQILTRGIEFLFGDARDCEPDQFLLRMRSVLTENRSIIANIHINFVFKGDPREAVQSQAIMSLQEQLESKKFLIDDFLDNKSIGFNIEFRGGDADVVSGVSHAVKTHRYQMDFSRTIASETPEGEKMQVGFVRLSDLYKMYQEMGPRFFDRNIRAGLSSEKPTNRSIRKTIESIVLKEELDPESFMFNHNGVTIAAEQLDIKKGVAYVTEPRLLNGAQTVTTLARFMEDNEENEEFQASLDILDRIKVLGKVICHAEEDFVSNVTICNNRQNPVEPWNLRANDLIQLEFQDKFRNELGLYYERQEGAFEHLSEDDLDDLGIESSNKAIQIKKLAQTFMAVQGEIDKMSRLRQIFENETIYRNTFRSSYLKADTNKLILAYKAQLRSNMVVRDIMEKYPNKYFYLNRAKNLIWSLIVQGILNDENIDKMRDEWGTSLAIEVAFADYLKDLSSRRIRFIIADVVGGERYQEMIEQGNFNFLRTKATFQRCMDVAGERFGWKKRSL